MEIIEMNHAMVDILDHSMLTNLKRDRHIVNLDTKIGAMIRTKDRSQYQRYRAHNRRSFSEIIHVIIVNQLVFTDNVNLT